MSDEAIDEAVAALNALDGLDPEADHARADAILLTLAPERVREAWSKAADRVGFWYA